MPETIIVVGDKSAPSREKIASLLEKRGFGVIAAASGTELLQKCLVGKPRLVISRVSLPDADCSEIVSFLRSDPLTRSLPVLILGSKKDYTLVEAGIIREVELFTGKTDGSAFIEAVENAVRSAGPAGAEKRSLTLQKGFHHLLAQSIEHMKRGQEREHLFRRLRDIPLEGGSLAHVAESSLGLIDPLLHADSLVFYLQTLSRPLLIMRLARPATDEYKERLTHVVATRLGRRGNYINLSETTIQFLEPPAGDGALLSGDILFYGEPLGEGPGFIGLSVSTMKDKALIEEKLGLFRDFSRHAYTVIESVYLHELFGKLSTIDSLTQVSNRHRVIELLKKELVRAKRYFLDLSVMLFDIDNFKTINDFYGYQVGDVILKDLARITVDTMRSIDDVGRYGGEEFLVVLPETNLKNAQIAGNRIKSRVQGHVFPGIAKDIKISLSIGITSYLRDVDISVDDMLRRTDMALGEAKKKGKNCVYVVNR